MVTQAVVRVLLPGGAIVGAVLAAMAWQKRRRWAGIRVAAFWLLAPWAMLLVVDILVGGGLALMVAINEIVHFKLAVLAPVVWILVVVVDVMRLNSGSDEDPKNSPT